MLSYGYDSEPQTSTATKTDMPNRSRSTLPPKFFERHLDNDLTELASFLSTQYEKIESGELLKTGKNTVQTAWDNSGSQSTVQWNRYNALQFVNPYMHNLTAAIKSMTQEACDYYGIDFNSQQYYVQSWFNINHAKKGKLDWHEHGGKGAPHFHGFYCVQAEPSITHYKLPNDVYFDNINKNNRAILGETGHPHAMADWSWDGPRITIAYDVLPRTAVDNKWEQHWVPLV
jgi:hypothetical protein